MRPEGWKPKLCYSCNGRGHTQASCPHKNFPTGKAFATIGNDDVGCNLVLIAIGIGNICANDESKDNEVYKNELENKKESVSKNETKNKYKNKEVLLRDELNNVGDDNELEYDERMLSESRCDDWIKKEEETKEKSYALC